MSTGLECRFNEVEPKRWFYVLQDDDCPHYADWLDYATATGPFATFEEAQTHLHRHHANPGGYSRYAYDRERVLSKRFLEIINRAVAP